MDVITIEAQGREPGKKAARAARRAGMVPCVLYGSNVDSVSFQVPTLALKPLIFTSETHRVTVKVNGKKWDCVLKHVDYHPFSDTPLHADFQVLVKGSKITLMVPVKYNGTPVGQVHDGGDTQVIAHEVEVTCLPDNIPSHIEVDIAHLKIGDAIHLGDLEVEGVEFTGSLDQPNVPGVAPRVAEEVEVEAEEGADVQEAEEAAAEGEGEVTE